MRVALLALLVGCSGTARSQAAGKETRPDALALERHTSIEAETARVVASDHWKAGARLNGIRVETLEDGTVRARGGAVLKLGNLSVEAREIRVRWLPDHQDFLLYAEHVKIFEQKRDQPYRSEGLAAVTMANDQVSFFKQ